MPLIQPMRLPAGTSRPDPARPAAHCPAPTQDAIGDRLVTTEPGHGAPIAAIQVRLPGTTTATQQRCRTADTACPATAELSPSVANRRCPRLPSQVSGEHVQADRSRQGERRGVIVNIAQELGSSHSISHPRPEATFDAHNERKLSPAARWADTAQPRRRGGSSRAVISAMASAPGRTYRIAVRGLRYRVLAMISCRGMPCSPRWVAAEWRS